MQKKLRMRFLLISWGLLTLLLLAICGGVSIYMYQTAVDGTEEALRKAVETQTLSDENRGMVGMLLDEHGNILESTQRHLSLGAETLQTLAAEIGQEGEQILGETELDGARYRYLAVKRHGGAWAAAAECSHEITLVKTLKRNVLLFTLLGMAALLPICMLLASWVSRPIEIAWNKQNDFVSDATHELKTPLTVIATNTEAVMSNQDASVESQEKWLNSIQGETQRMAGLVGDLLFLAKIDAGEIKLEVEDVPLSDMLEAICMERESEIFEEGKQFDYDMTPDLHYQGDRKRIEQMFKALLDNAQRYTPAGKSIRVVVNRDRKLHPRIVISNAGNPIKEDDLTKIFERFYRVDPSRARETGGYGLGLCVAKSIAELHGGEITAECKNEINVFTVILGDAETKGGEN
ncbi:MAG TPA: hypothetical protein DDX71_03705 [Ruminococcus sp.]|nr:hypothetical protein [Ruminococcus sp.]